MFIWLCRSDKTMSNIFDKFIRTFHQELIKHSALFSFSSPLLVLCLLSTISWDGASYSCPSAIYMLVKLIGTLCRTLDGKTLLSLFLSSSSLPLLLCSPPLLFGSCEPSVAANSCSNLGRWPRPWIPISAFGWDCVLWSRPTADTVNSGLNQWPEPWVLVSTFC